MKKFVLYLLLLFSCHLKAQDKGETSIPGNRWVSGGNFAASFGTITYVDISPLLGYRITRDFTAGAGLTYLYSNYRTESSYIYGGRLWARYFVFENIFGHIEYEILNVPRYNPINGNPERIFISAPIAGGGYRQPIGENSYYSISVLWNMAQSVYTPYQNPIINMGFIFGL